MFPNLVLKSGGKLHASATGVPSNGANTFLLGIPVDKVDEKWLTVFVKSLGVSVSSASDYTLSPDKTQITINFNQSGGDQAYVEAVQTHTAVR